MQQQGSFAVRLLDASWNADYRQENALTNYDNNGNSRSEKDQMTLRMELLENNQFTTNWRIHSVTLDNASGNHVDPQVAFLWGRGGIYSVYLRNSLWPTEPIRYRMEFTRRINFDTNEVWTVSGLSVPEQKHFTPLGLSNIVNGQQVIIQGLVGYQARVPWHQNLSGGGMFAGSSLDITTPGMPRGNRLILIKVEDDLGHQYHNLENAVYSVFDNPNDDHGYFTGFSAGAQKVSIQLTVQKSIFVDFTVQPRVVSTNTPLAVPRIP